MRRARGALLVALLCAACGGPDKKPSVPSDKLWADGDQAMQDEAYDFASRTTRQLLEQYPFDPNAEEAELKIAEAYFNAGRYPEAIAAFGDFERMHPTSDNLAQIEYRRGMAYLAQHRSSGSRPAGDQERARLLPQPRRPLPRHAVGDRAPSCACASAARSSPSTTPGSRAFYLQRGSLRAAESRLRGLLDRLPGDAGDRRRRSISSPRCTPRATSRRRRTSRSRPSPATTPTARSGATRAPQLKSLDPAEGQDPLPMLVARIDAMRTQADRENAPAPGVGLLRPARRCAGGRRATSQTRGGAWGRCLRSRDGGASRATDMIELCVSGGLSRPARLPRAIARAQLAQAISKPRSDRSAV